MKNIKKSIISASVAAATILANVPTFAAIPSDVKGTRFEEPVQILSALDIMVGDENGEYRLDDTIIRSEVTKMAVHLMGLEDAAESAKGQTMFDDVSRDHWANGYINLAVSQGIIEGDGDGNFRPNDPISYAEAMVIMVRATGYTVPAEERGGYPKGYVNTAASIGLSKNVQGSSSEEISRGNVAYLTANALEVNLMEQTGFGQNASYEVTDKTLLKDHLNVTKGTGQVTAIQNTSINGASGLSKGQIKIGDNVYDTAHNMNHLLGYNVTYYLHEEKNGTRTLILAMPQSNQNKEIVISADMFSKVTTKNGNTAVEYYNNENSSKTTTVELASDATLIYNGKYEEMDTSLLDITDKSGNVTLLDFTKDGKYDIAFVTNYENMVVEEVTQSGKVVDKYTGKVLKLDDSVDFRIVKGFEEIEVSDLKEYDVLSVAASRDKELYEVVVTNEKIEGKVTGKDSKGVIIGGKSYKIAPNYTNTISIGAEGTFYLDVEGKIAAVDSSSSLSTNYGYLESAYFTKNTDRKAGFEIFTMDSKHISVTGNDKIKLNGKSGVSAEEVVKSLNDENDATVKQLVTYTVNSDGKLTAINTAVDNSDTGAVIDDTFTMNYVLTDAKYSKALSKLGNVRITDETVIFDITEDEDDYAIRGKDAFEDEHKYNAMVYDMSENYSAGVIVLTNAEFKANADSSMAVVKEVITAANANDEQTDMLIALVDGKEVSVYAKNESVLVKGEGKLEKGDLIQYKTNSDDEIVSVRVLMDINSRETEAVSNPAEKLETVYGKVVKKFTNSINVTVNDGSATNYVIGSDVTVYSVDMTKSKNNVELADVSDIQNFDEDENNRVFIRIYDDEIKEIVIIK